MKWAEPSRCATSTEPSPAGEAGVLLEHLFRHQAGRIVARLARLLGPAHLDSAEEAVQDAMLRALQTWPEQGLPENPAAWLFQVAHNAAIDVVRRRQTAGTKRDALVAELARSVGFPPANADWEEQLRDDELRLIFMCCHPALSLDARVALSLKVAGGFSVREIARAFLSDETTIAQRLVRAKRQIRTQELTLEMPPVAELEDRLDSALEAIYFLFNEGYTAHEGADLVRQDLCAEALRLGQLLATSSIAAPRVHALVALMALQAARLPARTNQAGDLVLLEDQDRGQWDQRLIALGFHHFDLAIAGERISVYHVQAAIAAEHTRQPVNWELVLHLYDQLAALNPSPVVALNRAVAVAKVRGPAEALAEIESLTLHDYYLLLSVRGHLLLELGRRDEAADCFRAALDCRCSEPERRFLQKRLAACA